MPRRVYFRTPHINWREKRYDTTIDKCIASRLKAIMPTKKGHREFPEESYSGCVVIKNSNDTWYIGEVYRYDAEQYEGSLQSIGDRGRSYGGKYGKKELYEALEEIRPIQRGFDYQTGTADPREVPSKYDDIAYLTALSRVLKGYDKVMNATSSFDLLVAGLMGQGAGEITTTYNSYRNQWEASMVYGDFEVTLTDKREVT